MTLAPQERLALGVVALLLALGTVVQSFRPGSSPATWDGSPAQAIAQTDLEVRTEAEIAREVRRNTPLADGERLDPNTASADELERLPQVGPALAERIVAWRTEHRSFRTLADLDSVAGVGPATLERLAPHLLLSAAPKRSGVTGGKSAVRPALADAPLDLNRATAAELEALPRIGPAIAERIVAFRTEHGRFGAVSDLEKVAGIGPRTIDLIAPRLRVTP